MLLMREEPMPRRAANAAFDVRPAEQRLIPTVRTADGAIVTASGVSCREQTEHGVGRQALHSITVVGGVKAQNARSLTRLAAGP